jgi:hypothetical protein
VTPDPPQPGRRIPLTFWQRVRLASDVLPALFFTAAVIAVPQFLRVVKQPLPPAAFYAFVAVVILYLAFVALQRVRDLASGSTIVEYDQLERVFGSMRGGFRAARFQRLGRVRLASNTVANAIVGSNHRLHYSPASKIVWVLTPVDRCRTGRLD